MRKRGDRKAARQLALGRERQRRQAGGPQRHPGSGPSLRFHPNGRPGFSEVPWGDLSASDARKLKWAMLIAYIGDRAVQANDFLEWGLRPRPRST